MKIIVVAIENASVQVTFVVGKTMWHKSPFHSLGELILKIDAVVYRIIAATG